MSHIYVIYWSLLYSAILRSWADSLCSHVILHKWIAFYSAFLNIHQSGTLTTLAWLVPQESAARESQSRRILCTPYNHAPCHFMQSHIRKVYACLAVTYHLCFWQNDQGLLRATAVTLGWNRYWNKSQHRKLTLEKKILLPLQQGFKPVTSQSRVRHSNLWAIPALERDWGGLWGRENGAPGQRGQTWDRVGGRGRRVGYAADACSSCWGWCRCCVWCGAMMSTTPSCCRHATLEKSCLPSSWTSMMVCLFLCCFTYPVVKYTCSKCAEFAFTLYSSC